MASSNEFGTSTFNVTNVNLTSADPRDVICALAASANDYNGMLGARISSIFVIGIISTSATFFPVVARRVPRMHIPLYVYLFARYFGAGVIVATAFIHLLDPAYSEIGPQTCVGMAGGWAEYSWPPAIVLTSVMLIFLLDFGAERYVEVKYGAQSEADIQDAITGQIELRDSSMAGGHAQSITDSRMEHIDRTTIRKSSTYEKRFTEEFGTTEADDRARQESFRQQIAAFLILEFGVIFHSVIIGLNLGVTGSEFSTLYVVLVFHQSFEGLGIGARMSAIPFKKQSKLPWILCLAYGLTTPLCIAIGLGLRHTYNPNSFTANVVSGVLDSMSAGILIYTGLVELLARDFLFNPLRTKDNKRLAFMIACVFIGAALMSLLGKWA